MSFLFNLDLLSVIFVIAGTLILGFVVYFNNTKSITNKIFLSFTIITTVWGILNYISYKFHSDFLTLWLLKLVLFLAVLQAVSLFYFLRALSLKNFKLSRLDKFIVLPTTLFVAFLTLTPFVFSSFRRIIDSEVVTPTTAPGIIVFGITTISLVLFGMFSLIKKIISTKNSDTDKKPLTIILLGVLLMFFLIIIFNFIFPVFLNNIRFIPFGSFFVFPFIAFTSYAILRHHLFSTKAMWAGVLVFALAIASFLEVIFATSLNILIFRGSVFLLVLMVGILLIKGVLKEVKIRERMEKLAEELAAANRKLQELDQQKSEFLSIASHQLRTPLTAIKGYSSMLLEGSFGQIASGKMREAIERVFDSSQRLVVIVNDLLNVSRIEQGRMKYDFNTFNMKEAAETVINEMRPIIEKKKLEFEVKIENADYTMTADAGKLSQVISNLLDNALKYTPSGKISFRLSKKNDGKILFLVADTGVGVPKGEAAKLFKKFSRTKDASKTSASGTGLGLYVVDQMVKAHKGRVWVESAGKGKGSTFFVEVPVHTTAPENSA